MMLNLLQIQLHKVITEVHTPKPIFSVQFCELEGYLDCFSTVGSNVASVYQLKSDGDNLLQAFVDSDDDEVMRLFSFPPY